MNSSIKKINSEILSLAIPSILANITVPLVGMVDIAVAGNLGTESASLIGGIALGSMLFDLLYWNFSFLRAGTGGLTAQAFGRNDFTEVMKIFVRAVGISLVCALVLIAVHRVFVDAALWVVDATPAVKSLAAQYFFIRIWAAPATLSLMAFKGWFIGVQDSLSAMIVDFVVNGMNIGASIVLAMGWRVVGFEGIGFAGIALGTVAAQYSGLLAAVILVLVRHRKYFSGIRSLDFKGIFKGGEMRRFFVMNADLLVRSLCFIGIYIGFTTISAAFGDLLLATGSIMMKLLLLFSYFTDGFAYAGEAMSGKYKGAGDGPSLNRTVRWTFAWSMGIAGIFVVIYYFGGSWLLRLMSSDPAVLDMSSRFLPWLLLMPLVGCPAFTWDGIYIGVTASRKMRDSMLWAVAGFFLVYYLGLLILDSAFSAHTADHDIIALHLLMAAYLVHLLIRTIHLSCNSRKILACQ